MIILPRITPNPGYFTPPWPRFKLPRIPAVLLLLLRLLVENNSWQDLRHACLCAVEKVPCWDLRICCVDSTHSGYRSILGKRGGLPNIQLNSLVFSPSTSVFWCGVFSMQNMTQPRITHTMRE